MFNDRPINDPNLQAGLDEVKQVMIKRGLAGACILVAPNESAYTYGMHAPWSAIQPDTEAPLKFRIRTSVAEHGEEGRHSRLEGAAHTVCTLCDFGYQTASHMEDLIKILRSAGLEFEHTPYGGNPLPHIGTKP